MSRPDTRIVHRCNAQLDPICGTPFKESGGNTWTYVNCPDCIRLAADSPQVEALRDMLRNWPSEAPSGAS